MQFHLHEYQGKSIGTGDKLVVATDSGEEDGVGYFFLMGTGFPPGVMKKFRNWMEDRVAQHCECT